MKAFKSVLVFVTLGLTACAGLQEGPKIKKEIKDVSYHARSEGAQPRKRIMILPFLDAEGQRPQEMRDNAREDFISEVNGSGSLIAVDSKELNLDLKKFMANGGYNFSELAKSAKSMGVSAVLEGKLLDLNVKRKSDTVGLFRQMKTVFECKAQVRIASAQSGKELFNTVKTVTIEESNVRVAENVDTDRFLLNNPQIMENLVKETFLDFAPQIVATLDKLAWEGRVAMINGDRIFLNVGRISGLQIGDILKVSEEGDEIYDPQTGNYIGKSPGRLKGTLEVVSYFGQDGAISIIHSGAGFRENDRVELY